MSHNECYENRFLKWIPPPTYRSSLNVDGCCKGKDKLAGSGGLLHTSMCDWIVGFTHNIGRCSIEEAEL
ncbi:ribonuclease H protein-like [Dorcoceras hygrometricum]|uniref:Ribonuclease H protein-like n=1 Tax=Dorcoceras hygrometricum TaxID=472368 RepID=A0A2Z7D3P0_9LAMI|nr:ribonuclease H protein-like [Dorcoceras hygrometricum]